MRGEGSLERPIHVCILACQHVPDDVRVTHRVGRSFREAGFRVTWIGPRRERRGDDYGIDFRYYELGRGKLGRLFHFVNLYRLARQVDNVDVWYAVEPDSGRVAVSLARRRGGRSVMSIHEIYHDEMLGRWASGALRTVLGKLVQFGMRRICAQCDLVEGVGSTRIEPYDTGKSETLIVRHCSPREFAGYAAARPFESDRTSTIVMHGKATSAQGTREAMEAVARAHNRLSAPPRLVVFTPNMPTPGMLSRQQLVEQEKSLGSESFLDYRDFVPYRQMFDILRTCDVGMILYNREWGTRCMPNRIFEYMAVGLPVIAPAYSIEISSIMREIECGLLVDAEQPEAIAEALVYLSENPEKAREMGEAGRKAFFDHLNWEEEVLPLIEWVRKGARLP